MKVSENITELIGNTPLCRLSNIEKKYNLKSRLLAKIEFFNPGASVKDRIALNMIESAESQGLINKDTVLVEPTSGNTGIGLAMVAASRGYRLTLVMPESMSIERRKIFAAYGADLVLTPASGGMKAAIDKAEDLVNSRENYLMLQQFKNPANPDIHRKTTAMEIWNDTEGNVDVFVAGVGTGGTITGVSEILKSKNPDLVSVAVEPVDSPVLSGGEPGPHKIQGIGAGFVPDVLNREIIDRIEQVKYEDAVFATCLLAGKEGILSGISTGANLYAAIKTAKEIQGKTIVFVVCDTGERYLTTPIFD